MKLVVVILVAAFTLAACGVDGEPTAPKVSAKTTIGFNSKTGVYNNTSLGVEFKL